MRTFIPLMTLAALVATGSARAQPARRSTHALATVSASPAPPPELTETDASGLTADEVGRRAAASSFNVKAYEATLRAAAARVDEAWMGFVPKVTGVVRAMDLSNFSPPPIDLPVPRGLEEVFTTEGPQKPGSVLNTEQLVAAPLKPFYFAPVLHNYLLEATIVVPISDYFLRINQAYSAATHSMDAASYDAGAARAKALADGKAAFYTWLRARGAAVVAIQALAEQKAHLADATNQFAVGGASRADVLVAETAVASAELSVERAKDLAALTEKQIRLAIHAKETEHLVPAEDLETELPRAEPSLSRLTEEALSGRLEVKSIEANAAAARSRASLAHATLLPTVSAFADAIDGNPNPRVIPQNNQWTATWDVGVQITWSPNEAIGGGFAGSAAASDADALDAQRSAVRDGIKLEAMQAFQAVRQGDVAVEVTKREVASATEAYRASRDLFLVGRAAGTMLTDRETELTRARLDALNAKADARIARVRLDHALGRDAKRPVD
jgi:outer membrane protein TolC